MDITSLNVAHSLANSSRYRLLRKNSRVLINNDQQQVRGLSLGDRRSYERVWWVSFHVQRLSTGVRWELKPRVKLSPPVTLFRLTSELKCTGDSMMLVSG